MYRFKKYRLSILQSSQLFVKFSLLCLCSKSAFANGIVSDGMQKFADWANQDIANSLVIATGVFGGIALLVMIICDFILKVSQPTFAKYLILLGVIFSAGMIMTMAKGISELGRSMGI